MELTRQVGGFSCQQHLWFFLGIRGIDKDVAERINRVLDALGIAEKDGNPQKFSPLHSRRPQQQIENKTIRIACSKMLFDHNPISTFDVELRREYRSIGDNELHLLMRSNLANAFPLNI